MKAVFFTGTPFYTVWLDPEPELGALSVLWQHGHTEAIWT